MQFKPDTFHLTMALLLVFLALLAYRFIRILLRRSAKKTREARPDSELLMDALRERTEGERQAVAHQQASAFALQAMQVLHSRMIEHMPVGLAVLETQGRIAYVNPLAVQWLGPPPHSLDLSEWCSPVAAVFHHRSAGNDVYTQLLRINQEGRQTSLLVSLSKLPDDRWMLTLQDQTKMLRLEEQVRVKRDLALMGEMASGIAHEVKNALALIQGHVQLLPYGDVPDHSNQIQMEIDRLLSCVRQFLQSSKGEALNLMPLSVKKVLEGLEQHWQQHQLGDRVIIEIPNDDTMMRGDLGQLLVLFNNLVLNGLEACQVSAPAGHWVRVHVRRGTEQFAVAVEDRGLGFSDDVMAKLFVPFVSTKEEGSGFGLFHCRRIMLQHHGSIEVEQGAPTQVCCYFPSDRPDN